MVTYFFFALALLTAPAAAQSCTSDADCSGTIPTCVEESIYYSACTDCGANAFAQQCVYYSSSFLAAAENACGLPCAGRCPGGADAECIAGNSTGSTCLKDDSGDLCIDCTDQDVFDQQCFSLSDELVVAAETSCGLTCTGRCPGHSDAACPQGEVCAVQADGNFDECVSCTPGDFETECVYMSDQMRAAAEDKCGIQCNMTSTTRNLHHRRWPKRTA